MPRSEIEFRDCLGGKSWAEKSTLKINESEPENDGTWFRSYCPFFSWVICRFHVTLRESNIAMENGPFEDVFPIKHGDIPLLC